MGTTKAELIEAHGAVRPRLAGHDKLIVHDANLHWFADAESPVIDGIGHGLLEGHHRENSLPWWIRPGHGADADRVRQVTGRRSGLGIPIARGSLLSCPVDRDHHRHTVHAPGGLLPRDSYPGRHIVPFERSFFTFLQYI